MISNRFLRKIRSLYWLVRIQRFFRVLLRSTWIGGAGYLLAWGANTLWGWLPDSSSWSMFGASLALLNLLTLIFRRSSFKNFVWNIDRKLGMNEQLSTAVELINKDGELLSEELIEDSLALIPGLRKRIIGKGWRLMGEVEALIIVLILLLMVYLAGIGPIPLFLPGGLGFLPGLGRDPNAEGVFPSGLPGMTPGDAEQLGIGNDNGDDQNNSGLTQEELGEINDILKEMGQALEDNASTSEFGQSLQQGDFGNASDELSNLAENFDDLSDQTKENLEESFRNAANELQQPNQQTLSEALREASEAIRAGDDVNTGEKLDELAAQIDMLDSESFDDQQANESNLGVGEPEIGEGSKFERILGEGDTFDLDEFGPSSLIQTSEGFGEDGDLVVSGELDYLGPSDGTMIEGMISPYNLPWDKINVVTTYFTP